MTESPIAVTCRPDTCGSFAAAVRHAAAGAKDAGEGDEDAGDADAGDADAGDADGPPGTAPGPVPAELAWAEA
jgi:hypothetical protein